MLRVNGFCAMAVAAGVSAALSLFNGHPAQAHDESVKSAAKPGLDTPAVKPHDHAHSGAHAHTHDHASAASPRTAAVGTAKLGWQKFDERDYAGAIDAFQAAIKLHPDYAPGYFGIAYVYSTQNKLKEAVPYYRQTIERDPSFPDAYGNLARAQLSLGETAEAEKNLDEALKRNPKLGSAVMNFAYYYAEQKDWDKANKYAKDAIARGAEMHPLALKEFQQHGFKP